MVYINGTRFNSFPECCYVCPFFLDWGQHQQKGTCTLFHKQKSKYNNPPKRCQQLFDKAKTFPDGSDLVIVVK